MNLLLLEPGERVLDRSDPRARHIRKVLRLRTGDEVRAGEVGGPVGIARIADDDSGTFALEFEPREAPRALPPVCLIVGHPRPIVLRRLLRDLTTIGPAGIVVTHTDLGEKSYYESNLWADVRTPLLDGAAQGGTTLLPSVRKAGSLAEAARAADSVVAEALPAGVGVDRGGRREPRRLVLHADRAGEPDAVAAADADRPQAPPAITEALGTPDPGTPVVLAVGSERGWTAREVDALAGLGFVAATLGDRVLRTETSALVATWAAVSWYHRRS
ncbi:MAG: 16S rRNA (uracil(1498)-N(3))-methyltransferase [Spirochaetota bacterium]